MRSLYVILIAARDFCFSFFRTVYNIPRPIEPEQYGAITIHRRDGFFYFFIALPAVLSAISGTPVLCELFVSFVTFASPSGSLMLSLLNFLVGVCLIRLINRLRIEMPGAWCAFPTVLIARFEFDKTKLFL